MRVKLSLETVQWFSMYEVLTFTNKAVEGALKSSARLFLALYAKS
jgi:hypothetical protein